MTCGTVARIVDESGTRALVVGSLPPGGRDLDLLVASSAEHRARAALDAAGCVRKGRSHALIGAGTAEAVDVVPGSAWGLTDADIGAALSGGLPVAGYANLVRPSPGHVLLLAARRLSHAGTLDERRRARVTQALADHPGAWEAARSLAAAWHVGEALAALRTTYTTGVEPPASVRRRLVRERTRAAGGRRSLRPPARRRGAVVAISGLDGSGKSTQGQLLADTLQALGVDAAVEWRRLAQGSGLDAVAAPVKRLLRKARGRRPEQTVAVHYSRSERDSASQLRQRSAILTWAWSIVVTAMHVRSQRAAVVPQLRAGRVVVCDRYTLDSVVTLRFRYGAGRLHTGAVRLLTPRAKVAVYLDITPEESLRRKDDGYEPAQLETMHALYARAWPELGVARLDGTRPSDELAAEIAHAVWLAL
jgi:thymidylate kinase